MGSSVSAIQGMLDSLRGQGASKGELSRDLLPVLLSQNRGNSFRFLSTPYAERTLFLPQCLRSTAACQADERNGEYICKKCGACKIAAIIEHAEKLGYGSVRILKGGSALARMIEESGAKAVLGVACGVEGVMGILLCERAGVPAFCVPLLRDGCSDTDVDLEDVKSALEAKLP